MVSGSFFEQVPGGAGGYLLKDILHDWDDDRSRKILANVRRAATRGSRLLLVESLLERNETVHPKPLFDLKMMIVSARAVSAAAATLLGCSPIPAFGSTKCSRWLRSTA